MPSASPLLLAAVSAGLLACASEPAPASEWRVLVKLVSASDSAEAIARRASESAGVPVRYATAVSPQWHGLSLACPDEARCASALQRLQDRKSVV